MFWIAIYQLYRWRYENNWDSEVRSVILFWKLPDLDLANNKIKSLPDELAELPDLRSLNISNNKFTELPPVVYQLKKLKDFDAANNTISGKLAEVMQHIWSLLNRVYLD